MRAWVRASVSARARVCVGNTRVRTCVKGRIWAQLSAGRHSDATNWTFQLPELQVPAGHPHTDGLCHRLWDVSKPALVSSKYSNKHYHHQPGLQRSSVRIRCHSASTSERSTRNCRPHGVVWLINSSGRADRQNRCAHTGGCIRGKSGAGTL